MNLCFEDCIDDERVLANVLRENFKVLDNHWGEVPFTSEQTDFDLFSWISVYFF